VHYVIRSFTGWEAGAVWPVVVTWSMYRGWVDVDWWVGACHEGRYL